MFLYRSSPRMSSSTRRVPGEKDGGLAGGVAAAHDHHAGTPAQLRLGGRRGVVDAGPFESLATLDAQPAVLRPGGDQQALGGRPSRRRRGAESRRRCRTSSE